MSATTGVRQKAMLKNQSGGASDKKRQNGSQWDQPKYGSPYGCTDQDERHAPPNAGAQPVGPGTHRWLDEQGSNVIQGHKETDECRFQAEFLCQENGDKCIVYTPDDTDTKKTKAE